MIKVKNWAKFQHFKNRRPPWVKLYRDLLDDLEWHRLDGDSAKHLVMLWLLASEGDDGELPPIHEIAFRLRITEKQAKTTMSRLHKWVVSQDDIMMISPRYHDDTLEREREREKEKEKKSADAPARKNQWGDIPEGVNPDAWTAWTAYKGGKPKPATITALRNLLSKHPPEVQLKAVENSIANGYAGLFPEKHANEKSNGTSGKPVWETPADRRRQLDEAIARAEGVAGVEADDGNVRGQILEGVWSRAE